jgi:predicted pyridoxine 5'-phosphate oxidase superfamily flavin-nucleotide-binding protein
VVSSEPVAAVSGSPLETPVRGAVHAGEQAVQERAGLTFPGVIRNVIPGIAAAFLAEQPVIVVAGRDEQRRVWTTMLAGAPGFLEATGPRTVRVRALPLPSDPLAPLLAGGGPVGMIAWDRHRRMRMNGILEPRPDGFVVQTEQVYSNCLKYISERHASPRAVAGRPQVAAGTELTDAQIERIRSADTFFIGTAHPDGPADASHRGGNPGWVLVDAPDRLRWPDYVGNSMFMTLGNLTLDPHVGLLFPDWAGGGLLQLSGRARLDWDPASAAPLPGAQRVVEMTVDAVQQTDEALGLRWTEPVLSHFNPAAAPA